MEIFDHKHLPEERLATYNEKGWRVYLFPAAVHGVWRKRRTILQVVLIAIFLLLPWLNIGGHQAVLFDIPRRQFALFGLTFWAHDTPILFLVVLLGVITLAFVTAIWGRIWCGWACPQTVFIDGVFRRIEQWVIGNHITQMQLAKAPWSAHKIYKVGLKWALFIFAGLFISHSFLAYFVGADRLWPMITSSPTDNWSAFLAMGFVSLVIIFDFGWFREQFCIIMCPYGRIQSVLMDQGSLGVMYDEKRGEPRGKIKQGETEKRGDCIDCFKCVAVCPTGIDIRRGTQMECIACTACIDACDDVMEKIKRPTGLIRYSSHAQMDGKGRKVLTLRLMVYVFFLLAATAALIYSVTARESVNVEVIRGVDKPYELVASGEFAGQVLNHFKLHIKNQEFHDLSVGYELVLSEELREKVTLISPVNPLTLKPGELSRTPFFVRLPKELFNSKGQKKIQVKLKVATEPPIEIVKEVKLVGPFS